MVTNTSFISVLCAEINNCSFKTDFKSKCHNLAEQIFSASQSRKDLLECVELSNGVKRSLGVWLWVQLLGFTGCWRTFLGFGGDACDVIQWTWNNSKHTAEKFTLDSSKRAKTKLVKDYLGCVICGGSTEAECSINHQLPFNYNHFHKTKIMVSLTFCLRGSKGIFQIQQCRYELDVI